MKRLTRRSLLILFVSVAACSGDTSSPGDTDSAGPDTGVGDTLDTVDTSGGDTEEVSPDGSGDSDDTADDTEIGPDGEVATPLEVTRRGARMLGAPIQLSVTDTGLGRFLWIGTRANVDPSDGRLRGGLVRYDLVTGETRRFEDELPREDYGEFMPTEPGTFGPAPTAGVQADQDGYVVVARTGLLSLSDGEFAERPIVHQGQTLVPVQLAIAREGLRPVAWMTSDVGLVRLDEDSFAVEAVVRGVDLGIEGDGGGDFGRLAVDPDTGAVYAGYFTSDGRSALVKVGVDNSRRVWVTGTGGPRGRVGDLVFSGARGGVYAALAAWDAGDGGVVFWDGDAVVEVAREGALAEGFDGERRPFGAQALALDEAQGVLAVGGQLRSGAGGIRGGGLVFVRLGSSSLEMATAQSRQAPFIHWHITGLAFDAVSRELFVVGADLCSETKLRARGLFGLRFLGGEPVYRRPVVSTVRALAEDGGDLWLGLRDDNGGMACDSVPIQTGFGRLEGGGLTLASVVGTSGDGILVDPGVTAVAADGLGVTLGTWRDGYLVGAIERKDGAGAGRVSGFVGNPALIGPSLFLEAVAQRAGERGAREVWLAGRTSHQPGDPPVVADRGPRGMAKLLVNEGALVGVTRYVRASETAGEVVGMPSGDVRDLVMTAAGDVLAACAKERLAPNYDRDERPAFALDGETRGGGVVRVRAAAQGAVEVLAGPEVTPDPRALALDAAGRLVVADAERGLLRSREALAEGAPVFEVVATPGLPAGARPLRVWAGSGEDLAVATSAGLWVRYGGRTLVVDDVGFVWSLRERDGRLFAGSDEGLVVVGEEGAPAPWPPLAMGEAVPFASR